MRVSGLCYAEFAAMILCGQRLHVCTLRWVNCCMDHRLDLTLEMPWAPAPFPRMVESFIELLNIFTLDALWLPTDPLDCAEDCREHDRQADGASG